MFRSALALFRKHKESCSYGNSVNKAKADLNKAKACVSFAKVCVSKYKVCVGKAKADLYKAKACVSNVKDYDVKSISIVLKILVCYVYLTDNGM